MRVDDQLDKTSISIQALNFIIYMLKVMLKLWNLLSTE